MVVLWEDDVLRVQIKAMSNLYGAEQTAGQAAVEREEKGCVWEIYYLFVSIFSKDLN